MFIIKENGSQGVRALEWSRKLDVAGSEVHLGRQVGNSKFPSSGRWSPCLQGCVLPLVALWVPVFLIFLVFVSECILGCVDYCLEGLTLYFTCISVSEGWEARCVWNVVLSYRCFSEVCWSSAIIWHHLSWVSKKKKHQKTFSVLTVREHFKKQLLWAKSWES